MSIQKKILYVVVIILAIIGLLSIIPMPEGYSFNMSNAMSPISEMEEPIEGERGYTVPDVPGGGGSGGGTSDYGNPTISYEGPINVPWSSPTVWEWTRPRRVTPRVRVGEPYGWQGGNLRTCMFGYNICW